MAMDNDDSLKRIAIYTDGAAEPNPGPAGYGVVLKYKSNRKELSEGFQISTNNRMELLAIIVGLEALAERCCVTLYSDSKYVVDAVNNGSLFKWRDKNWWRTRTARVKNIDLWQRFLEVYEKHKVTLRWIKGHAGNPENERCDKLAVAAAQKKQRQVDSGYVNAEKDVPLVTSRDEHSRCKVKHKEEGELCRKCGTPVEKRTPKKKHKSKQSYYYEWYLYCPGCKTMYMVEDAKRVIDIPKTKMLNFDG